MKENIYGLLALLYVGGIILGYLYDNTIVRILCVVIPIAYTLYLFRNASFIKMIKVKMKNSFDINTSRESKVNDSTTTDNDKSSDVVENLDVETSTQAIQTNYKDEIMPSLLIIQEEDRGVIRLTVETDPVDAEVFLSKNGSNAVYVKSPLEIKENCLLSLYAEYNNKKSETQKVCIDTFKVASPSIIQSGDTIKIECEDNDAEIYYTTNGENPNRTSVKYTSEFTINKNATIIAIAYKSGFQNSDTITYEAKIQTKVIDRIRKFTDEKNVIGISYRGTSHIKSNTTCQDYHEFASINEVWNVAIVSDGAGSAANSALGSKSVCAAFKFYISNLVKNNHSGDILDDKTWDVEFRGMLAQFQKDLKTNIVNDNIPFESLAATIIVLVFSPKGYMVAHVGDGRAGVKVGNEWKTIISPHKGEEANQTIFSTSKYFGESLIPNLRMSGVYVPETKVSEEKIDAFVLMSDGCENGAWVTYQRVNLPDGDFRVKDVNQPRFNALDDALSIIDSADKKNELEKYITEYSNAFKGEPDDKTILIGRNS